MNEALSLAILAGGNSTRFGEDKALALLHGRPLLAHILERTAGLAAETFLVTNRPEAYAAFGLPMVGDRRPGTGALGGLYTALTYAGQEWVICLACDMPLVNRRLLESLLALRAEADVVMPRLNGLWEPMHAVWRREACLASARSALERGERRVISALQDVRVRAVAEAEIDPIDPEHLSFYNVNTPDQLAEISRRLASHTYIAGGGLNGLRR